jgi:hypothetical protein
MIIQNFNHMAPVDERSGSVAKIIKTLHLDLEKGPWVAGGAVAKLSLGYSTGNSDIDIFISSVDQVPLLRKQLDTIRGHYTRENDIYKFKTHDDIDVQIIAYKTFDTLDKLFETFDFTICQRATDGTDILLTEKSQNDQKAGLLVREGDGYTHSSLRRAKKYMRYPYHLKPSKDIWEWVVKNRKFDENFYGEWQGKVEYIG